MRRFLFDRLCNPDQPMPDETHAKLVVMRDAIKEELQRLVSGRAYFEGVRKGHLGQKSVLNFGIDNPVDYAANMTDSKTLMQQVLEMVQDYEPRIINPKVQLVGNNKTLNPAYIEVTGEIKVADVTEEFSYTLRAN